MKLSYLCLPLATVYFFLLSYWSFLEKKNSLWYFLPCSSACFSPPIKMHCPSLPLKHFCLGFPKDSMCVCTCTRVCICVCVCMCVCMCVCVYACALGHLILHYSLLHVSLLALQDTIFFVFSFLSGPIWSHFPSYLINGCRPWFSIISPTPFSGYTFSSILLPQSLAFTYMEGLPNWTLNYKLIYPKACL